MHARSLLVACALVITGFLGGCGGSDDETETSELTCEDLRTCYAECDGDTCAKACDDDAGDGLAAAFDDLRSCGFFDCYPLDDTCLAETCPDEWAACN